MTIILLTTLECNSIDIYTSSTYRIFFYNISLYKFDLQYLIKEVALFLQVGSL